MGTATVMVLYVYKKLQSIPAIAGKNLLPDGSWWFMFENAINCYLQP